MGHADVCADCGKRLPADDFSSVRCDECQLAAGIKLWETQVLRVCQVTNCGYPVIAGGRSCRAHAALANLPISDADLGQLVETQAWAEKR